MKKWKWIIVFLLLTSGISLGFYKVWYRSHPTLWDQDYSDLEYTKAREILGNPWFTRGLHAIIGADGEMVMEADGKIKRVDINTVENPIESKAFLFADVWVNGYDVGNYILFPRFFILEYPIGRAWVLEYPDEVTSKLIRRKFIYNRTVRGDVNIKAIGRKI